METSLELQHAFDRTLFSPLQVAVPNVGPGDQVILVGSNPLIGAWDPDGGILLSCSAALGAGIFSETLSMPMEVNSLEYKYVIKHLGGGRTWEERIQNRRLILGDTMKGRELEVQDGEFDRKQGASRLV